MFKNFIPVNTPVIYKESKKNVVECLKTNWISSNGKFIEIFEKKFAKYHNRKFATSVSNGTAALEIAIKSLKLKKNSEVIIPAFSIISTAQCVVKEGLKPVLVDCAEDTWNVRYEDIVKKVNKKTKAIILTHIYGLPVDLKKILLLAKKKKIKVIEDAAEVIGLDYNNKKCGSFGDISTFSFYANKHITTGEGGMILTNEKKIFLKCKSLKNLSFTNSYYDRFKHDDIGWNYRFTNIQAAIGCGQLKNIVKIVKKKRDIGNLYYEKLKNLKNISLQINNAKYAKNIYWVFGVVIKKKSKINRNNVMKKLLRKGIDTRPFFVPMHKQPIFIKKKTFKKKLSFKNSEYISMNGFYLPSGLGV
jgi:perosamine synthetase